MSTPPIRWSPLKLSYHVRTYAFGARLIPERLGKTGLPEGIVAETWEVSDHRDAPATITAGPDRWVGKLLHELVEAEPDALVGEGWRGPHFPILGKFLDASHMLPVHLHADDETARRRHGEPHGKSEAWHILWCAPEATILAGIKPGLGHDELRAAFKAQDYDAVMFRYPIRPGDTVYVPGGILHSFGPDTLIYEAQQTSDLGQSVMPTDLHGTRLSAEQWDANIEATLAELKTDALPRPQSGLAREDGTGNRFVVGGAGPYFALERWALATAHREPAHPWRALLLSNVGGPVRLICDAGETTLERAESCLLPAAIGEVTVLPIGSEATDLVACYLPDLGRDVVAPLRAAGHSDAAIAALGAEVLPANEGSVNP